MRSVEMLTWGLAFLVFCKIIVHAQIIHSVDRMSEAIQSKAQLKGHMKEYIIAERKRLDELEKSLDAQEVSSQYENLTKKELEVAMSHPVRVFRFMNQMSYEVDSLTFGVNRQVVSYEFNKTLARLPKRKDFMDAANALSRLQQIYGGEADFTRPTADNTDNILTAAEVMEIANICLEGKSLACAMNNFRRAKEMFAEIGDITQSMIAYDFLAYVTHQQGNVEHALNYTLELRDHYHTPEGDNEETLDRLNENVRLYIEELGGDEMVAKNNVKELVKPEENYDSHEYPAYNALCRGEAIEVPNKETRQLMCHHYTNNNHPLLIISPAKQEEIHLDTGLSFFHHVLTDGETELLQRLASQKFEDSAMVADDAIEKDPTIEVTEDKAFSDQRVRSSNTGWVDDYESETIRDLSNRIGAILGLTTRSAEAFQVLSYGIGGFYLPHFDWGYEDQPFIGFDGNRIATWIFYLNDIKKGGATVFPDIGATVWPEKGGAAFWRNLHRNGTGNPLTLHAACPVLEGYKWASNKWFHTGGNEFSWPCGTEKDM